MSRNLRMLAALALVALLAGASFAVAQDGNSNKAKRERAAKIHRARVAAVDATVAKELGVTAAELRKAMRAAFESVGPPDRPDRDATEEELRAAMERHCTELTDAIGSELDKSGDDVRAAFKAAALARIDQAEENGRLDADEADELRGRVNDQSCMLGGPGGHHAFGFRGDCDGSGPRFHREGPGFGGHHGPGMGGPPAEMREGSYAPAPGGGGALAL